MRPIVFILIQIINLYIYLLIASAILSWLIAFNVVNTRNQFVGSGRGVSLSDYRAGPRPYQAQAAQRWAGSICLRSSPSSCFG